MQKINFQDYPSTDTPINSENLNNMQDYAEDAINGTVLYDGTATRGTTDNITLEETASHFDYLEVFFFNDTVVAINSVKIVNPDGKTFTMINSWDNETNLYYWSENASISGTSITRGTAVRWRFGTSGNPTRTTGSEVTVAILKVVGYKL